MKFTRRALLSSTAILLTSLLYGAEARFLRGTVASAGWQTVRMGGGGTIINVDVAPDGTKVCGADTFGAYIYDTTASKWQQLCTTSRLPANGTGTVTNGGAYTIRIAPSNSNVLYMVYGQFTGAGESYMFVSTNKGVSFVRTPLLKYMTSNNNAARKYGHHGAVDPINSDVMIVCSSNVGVYATANGTSGATSTWPQVNISGGTPIPNNDSNQMGCVAFDTSNGSTGGKTNNIYISVSGTGLYKSVNAGASYALVANMPAGVSIRRLKIDSDGTVYAVVYANASSVDDVGTLYKLTFPAGVATWTNINPAVGYNAESFIIDRNNVGRIAVFTWAGGFYYSINAGSSWTQVAKWALTSTTANTLALGNKTFTISTGQTGILAGQTIHIYDDRAAGAPTCFAMADVVSYTSGSGALVVNITAVDGLLTSASNWVLFHNGYKWTNTDAPWLSTISPYLGTGSGLGFLEMEMDSAGNITAAGGLQNVATMAWAPALDGTWQVTDQSVGIEQMVGRRVITSPNYTPLFVSEDIALVPGTGNVNVAPSRIAYAEGIRTTALNYGWAADFATSDPTFMAAVYGLQAPFGSTTIVKTTDGVHYVPTPTDTNSLSLVSGGIGVATPLNMVYAASNNLRAIYTLDGGTTWTSLLTLGGKTPGGGWGWSLFNPSVHVACDKHPSSIDGSNHGTFYMWNDGLGADATAKGLYKSTDGGQNWTQYTQSFGGQGVSVLKSPYGAPAPGHLFFAEYGFSGGAWSGPNTALTFKRSTNGGQTWTNVLPFSGGTPAIAEVWSFGFGAPAPGHTNYTVVIYGFYNNGSGWVHGVFRSIDDCVTWQKIGEEYPEGWTDWVIDIAGDLNTYGIYYITKSGSSYSIGVVP